MSGTNSILALGHIKARVPRFSAKTSGDYTFTFKDNRTGLEVSIECTPDGKKVGLFLDDYTDVLRAITGMPTPAMQFLRTAAGRPIFSMSMLRLSDDGVMTCADKRVDSVREINEIISNQTSLIRVHEVRINGIEIS